RNGFIRQKEKPMRKAFVLPSLILLAACGGGNDREQGDAATQTSPVPQGADSMASHDPAPGERAAEDIPDAQQRPVMQLQVVLERLGFGPGVIDGSTGMSTENALFGFQEANGLQVTGEYDDATRQALSRWSN